jgi:hypothetical protein
MNVIFLDIDGVLNSSTHGYGNHENPDFIEYAIFQLKRIVKDGNASIIISSSWRVGSSLEEMQCIFNKYQLGDYIIGLTPRINNYRGRHEEIKSYIKHADYPISNFVILDDDSDMDGLFRNFIKTDAQYGLTKVDAERAITILKRKKTK